MSPAEMRHVRGNEIGMVFQEPMTSLNPVRTAGDQIAEAIRTHQKKSHSAAERAAVDMLDLVGIPEAAKRARSYPHQMSGGMRQRVMIAMALSCDPKLLIADEPTTALDVTIQAQILELHAQLRSEIGMAMLLITHDLGIVAEIADRVAVMYAGRVVEAGPVARDLRRPTTSLHPGHSCGTCRRERAEIPAAYDRRDTADPAAVPPGCAFAGALPA